MSETKKFSRAELKSRNHKKDSVIVIHNTVYDVTKFLEEHPGGEEVLLDKAGEDATENFEDVGHSSDARSLMKKYEIGEIREEDRIETKEKEMKWSSDNVQSENSSSSTNAWIVPLILGILATIIYRYLFV